MTRERESSRTRPMNGTVARGSGAEKHFVALAGLPGGEAAHPEVIAPGVRPSPKHNLINYGGKTIQDLFFTNFYLGGAESWDQSEIQNIDKSLASAMSDTNLNNVMMQYFSNQLITSTFKPSQVLDGPKPSTFSQGDVENLVGQLYSQGRLSGFDMGNKVFTFMYPSGKTLTTDETGTHQAGKGPTKAASFRNPAHPEEEASS